MFKKALFILWLFALFSVVAYAGTSGKVVGVITAKDTNEPLIGVNVMIVGTTLGASTDLEGYYTILNVPVGNHNLKVSYIGYRGMIKQNIRVNLDLTTTVNFQLESEALDLGQEVVVVAERPMIRKDETNTNVIVTNEAIKNLPVRGLAEIAGLTAGVVRAENSSSLNIRGGRGGETATYIDGVLVTDPYNNAMRVYVPNRAIEELSVQTGGFNAEYGEAMSGIVALTTRTGSDRYHFTVDAVTDGFLSAEKKALGTYSYGFNEYTGTISGPIIPKKSHTFFLSLTRNYRSDYTPSYGWAENSYRLKNYTYYQPVFTNQLDSTGAFVMDTVRHDYKFNARLPGNYSSDWAYSGKVRFQLSKNMELRSSWIQTDRKFSQDFLGLADAIQPIMFFNTDHRPIYFTNTRSINTTFTHMFTARGFYDLKLNYFDTQRKTYDPVFKDDLLKYGDPTYNPWPDTPTYYGEAYTGRIQPDYFQPGCQYDSYFKQRTTYWGADFDLTYQFGKYHTVQSGFEYKYHTLRSIRIYTPSKLADPDYATDIERYRAADIRGYGYDLVGNEVNSGDYFSDVVRDSTNTPTSGFYNQKPYHPIVMSGYIQDKIEFKDLILNLGLRYDHINPNAWMFRQLAAQFDANGVAVPGTGMFGGDRVFDANDVKDSETYSYFSPRLGVSFPVTDRTVFHAQYGKFYQMPMLQDLYLSPFYMDNYVSQGGYFTSLNNPNLRPPRTISYEIGFKQTLADIASLQLTAFYKETEDLVQLVTVVTDVRSIAFQENGDFGAIKGFDFIFNLRRFKNLSASMNYELQYAVGTGSASTSNYDIAWIVGTRGNYPKFAQPLDFEQRHTGSVNVDYRFPAETSHFLRKTGVNLVFSFNSGNPYTRAQLMSLFPFTGRYDNDRVSMIPVSAVNGESTPWNYRLD
ncbi:TonB-dependent receptor, partial [candidate division KSB1 bacterium]|nr:TonB-dependent receptor [candidate division KSB1 bacterium]